MKIFILYGSLTGNTQSMAVNLKRALVQAEPEHQFEIVNLRELRIPEIQQYAAVILGTSTWDDGINNPDAHNFLVNLAGSGADLSGIHFALFGLGDSTYPYFCQALETIKPVLIERHADVYPQDFTIDGYPTDQSSADLTEWARAFIVQCELLQHPRASSQGT